MCVLKERARFGNADTEGFKNSLANCLIGDMNTPGTERLENDLRAMGLKPRAALNDGTYLFIECLAQPLPQDQVIKPRQECRRDLLTQYSSGTLIGAHFQPFPGACVSTKPECISKIE